MKRDKYALRYLPLFYDDLSRTIEYISKTLCNPQAAADLLNAVEDAILERSTCAESFEPYPSTRERKLPYYAIYVKNYVVYYVVLDHQIMEVRRFLYKGQDRWNMI